MSISQFIEYLTKLQNQGKGDYKIINGEYGYDISIDSDLGIVEVREDEKILLIW